MYKKILHLFVSIYIVFFSVFSVMRYRNMYANYFDLGIMHHVVYNTYKALQTGDWSRFLEHTDPNGYAQVVRSAVHNDIILAFFAPFYFLYPSPEVLLIIQSVLLGLGAVAIYGIGHHVFRSIQRRELYSLAFSVAYLLYAPLQLMNRFDFHAVALATPLILFMVYFWLSGRTRFSVACALLALITKEQVGITIAAVAGLYLLSHFKLKIFNFEKVISSLRGDLTVRYAFGTAVVSIAWVAISFLVIIPSFRGGGHFALQRYEDVSIISTLLRKSTGDYLLNVFGPVGFISLLSPTTLVVLPELLINLLSKDPNMRSVVFHYTAVMTPFVFISAMYGMNRIIRWSKGSGIGMMMLMIGTSVYFSATQGPAPYSQNRDLYVFRSQANAQDAREWAYRLRDDSIPVAATGNVGTFLSSRRKFYYFSQYYELADYVIIRPNEVFSYHDKETLIPIYQRLIRDPRYVLIDRRENFEVYKKI